MLARWIRSGKGIATPAVFLDLANEAGMISDIDEIVLNKGMQTLADLRASGLWIPRISVNASARSLRDPGYIDTLKLKVERYGLKPEDLAVEVLEETLVTDDDDIAVKTVQKLFEAGFAVEMDDFGAGYASMANLASLELSAVKLDKSLIAQLDEPAGQAIVRAIVSLCRELDLNVLAEGLETPEQAAILQDLDCKHAQGFWIGRPMASADLPGWIKQHEQERKQTLRFAS